MLSESQPDIYKPEMRAFFDQSAAKFKQSCDSQMVQIRHRWEFQDAKAADRFEVLTEESHRFFASLDLS